jgi:excinuclease ABC subunit C
MKPFALPRPAKLLAKPVRDFEQLREIVSKGFTERSLTEYIESFYREHEPPQTILMNFELPNKKLFEEFLQTWHKKTYPIQIIQPTSGQLLNVMHLAKQEAQRDLEKNASLSKYLKKLLKLSFEPRTIDCFDISQMQGKSMVGACVRFVDGKPDKKMFRHFIIKTVHQQDDYASLREIVGRRYKSRSLKPFETISRNCSKSLRANGKEFSSRVAAEASFKSGCIEGRNTTNLPDLILIDGGKGQLNAVKDIVPEIAFASLAKKEETLFSKNLPDGKVLNIKNIADQTLIALRDYTHHFAISFHRQREKF